MEYEFLTEAGVIVPDTSDTLAAVEAEYRAALGDDLDVSPSTPQGLLIAAETSARQSVLRNNAALANQINPDVAGGVFLDAIAALTRLRRRAATFTRIRNVTLTGVPSAIIPAGSRARVGVSGPEFQSVANVVLPPSGTATVDFQAVEAGAVVVGVGELDTIVDGGVLGWETVGNTLAGETGRARQSDLSLRTLRRNTLALQGVSLAEAITSALHNTDGVRSLQFRENVTDETQIIDGIELGPHSVWACVDGGTNQAVARALLANKSFGAGWNGDTLVNVLEPASGQTYPVLFDRPDVIDVQARVTVSQGTATVNPNLAIPEALVAYADGDEETFGEPGLGVGDNVSPFELASAINIVHPGFFVRKVEVAKAGDPWSTDEIVIALNEKASLLPGAVVVVVV